MNPDFRHSAVVSSFYWPFSQGVTLNSVDYTLKTTLRQMFMLCELVL